MSGLPESFAYAEDRFIKACPESGPALSFWRVCHRRLLAVTTTQPRLLCKGPEKANLKAQPKPSSKFTREIPSDS
jgi:hypothetical protein